MGVPDVSLRGISLTSCGCCIAAFIPRTRVSAIYSQHEVSRRPFCAQAQDRQRAHPRCPPKRRDPTVEETDRIKLHWTGADDRGIELHITGLVADEDPDLVIIIHAMPTAFRTPKETTT